MHVPIMHGLFLGDTGQRRKVRASNLSDNGYVVNTPERKPGSGLGYQNSLLKLGPDDLTINIAVGCEYLAVDSIFQTPGFHLIALARPYI